MEKTKCNLCNFLTGHYWPELRKNEGKWEILVAMKMKKN